MAIPKKEMDLELARLQWELDRLLMHMEVGYDGINVEELCEDITQFAENFNDFKARAVKPGNRRPKQVQTALELTVKDDRPHLEDVIDAKAKENGKTAKPEDVHKDSGQDTQVQRQRKTTARRN